MDTRTREMLRRRMERERVDLVGQLDALVVANEDQQDDYGAGNHLADDATELFLRERNLALRGNTEDLIGQIDAAIQRMDDGTYGTCGRCGQPIGDERLEALPYAQYCVACQSLVERERGA